jgi:predicted DsbA family dithiol-disulfide isomerase
MPDVSACDDAVCSAAPSVLAATVATSSIVLHWYDLTCPFCYLGQMRTRFLEDHGLTVVELPFQAHPDVPLEGVHIGQRVGPMYARIESDAAAQGLELNWPPRLPNSRLALAAAEWVRRKEASSFERVHARLFRAHFADGLDIGNLDTVLDCVGEFVEEHAKLQESLEWLGESERLGHQFGVAATPTWWVRGKTIQGFAPESEFQSLFVLSK